MKHFYWIVPTIFFSIFLLDSCRHKERNGDGSVATPGDSLIYSGNQETMSVKGKLNLFSYESVKRLFEKMDQQASFQPLLDLCSDSVVFNATIREGSPISGAFRGKKNVTEYFNKILPEVASFRQLQPLEFVVSDSSVVILGDDEYTIKKTGSKHHSPYAMVLKIQNGFIEEILIMQDLSALWEAYNR
jgi:ketosteroid isomerase-like protein